MPLLGYRFYFREGLPKVQAIKDKFFEITGLELGYFTPLRLGKLLLEPADIVYTLNRNFEDRNYIESPEFVGDRKAAKRDFHYSGYTYFTCKGFLWISLGEFITAGGKSFHIQTGGGEGENLYFYYALIKSMLEIGGHTYDYHYHSVEADPTAEDKLEPYLPHERFWKRIKKWDEMCEVERVAFIENYS